jgi:outer membrane biosynthesis protein TonB
MGRLTASLLACTLAAVLAVALSACGDSGADLLPGRTANEIESNLDEVARLAGEGECVGAADAAEQVRADVDSLGGVDAELKRALSEGASRLNEVVANCEEVEPVEEVETFEPEEELEPTEKAEKREKPEKPEKPEKEEKPEKPAKPEKEEAEAEEPEEETSPEPPSESGGTPSGGLEPNTPVEAGK